MKSASTGALVAKLKVLAKSLARIQETENLSRALPHSLEQRQAGTYQHALGDDGTWIWKREMRI